VPRIRTALAVALALAALTTLVAPAGAITKRRSTRAAALAAAVAAQVNVVRQQHGLRALRISVKLNQAAGEHSAQMAKRGYFSHSSADGTAFWKRIQRFYGSGGFHFWSVGENLLWSSPDVDAPGAIRMWLNSPEHRANLLSTQWREVGISVVHVPRAGGVYGGRPATIVTSDFGVRR
jgi:uncharacterized protein YkwD